MARIMLSTSDTAPTAIPAMASPCPPWLFCLIWLSATMPSTIPMIEPIPHSTPIAEATSEAMANGLVDAGAPPYGLP